jgi:uncharacterized LabA/DUF88 family protein
MNIAKHKDQRVGVFIDVPNLYHSAKNLYHAKVNFKEILKTAQAGRHLIRALAYSIKTEGGEEQAFVEALNKSGIEVKLKDLQIFPGGMKKGDWDVGLAVDAIKLGAKLDAVVLVTGDGDFVPLVEYLKVNYGCQVEAIAFGRSTSGHLKEVVDDFTDLGQNQKKYLIS